MSRAKVLVRGIIGGCIAGLNLGCALVGSIMAVNDIITATDLKKKTGEETEKKEQLYAMTDHGRECFQNLISMHDLDKQAPIITAEEKEETSDAE